MLEPVSVLSRLYGDCGLDRIQGVPDRAVPLRVYADLPAAVVSADDPELAKLSLPVERAMELAALAVRHLEGGGSSDQRAIGVELHRPDAQSIVAKGAGEPMERYSSS
jgi:hypothetical protein